MAFNTGYGNFNGGFNSGFNNTGKSVGYPNMNKVYYVSNLEEVKAFRLFPDGSITYFPCPADGCIYTKLVDINGVPTIQKFVPENANSTNLTAESAISALNNRVSELERIVQSATFNISTNATNAESANGSITTANAGNVSKQPGFISPAATTANAISGNGKQS